jgi:hypothetical protein
LKEEMATPHPLGSSVRQVGVISLAAVLVREDAISQASDPRTRGSRAQGHSLAYDATPSTQKAFDYVLKLPPAGRSELAFLAVIKPSTFAIDCAAQTVLERAAAESTDGMAQLQRRAQFAGSSTIAMVRLGHPVEQTVRAAVEWRASPIVTGERTGFGPGAAASRPDDTTPYKPACPIRTRAVY